MNLIFNGLEKVTFKVVKLLRYILFLLMPYTVFFLTLAPQDADSLQTV